MSLQHMVLYWHSINVHLKTGWLMCLLTVKDKKYFFKKLWNLISMHQFYFQKTENGNNPNIHKLVRESTKMQYSHTILVSSKKNQLLTHATKWINLTIIVKNTHFSAYHIIPFKWNIIWFYIYEIPKIQCNVKQINGYLVVDTEGKLDYTEAEGISREMGESFTYWLWYIVISI